MTTETTLRCIEENDDCQGPVGWHSYGGRMKSFLRCDHHHAKRLDLEEDLAVYNSPTPPSWFDPGYAGERWSEEDY